MSRHAYRVNVRSRVDGRILFRVAEREARLLCAEDSQGNPLDGMEPIADRLSRKKAALSDIQLKSLARDEKPSPCTLTKSDMLNNGIAAVNPELRKPGQFSDGSINPLRIGNYLDAAASKVEEWPAAHDQRNVVIAAGKAHGVIHVPVLEERYLNFA
jgi:hypothetical protein